jgi:hypothetical protein
MKARHSLFRRKMLEHVEGIVAASVKPLEKIQEYSHHAARRA